MADPGHRQWARRGLWIRCSDLHAVSGPGEKRRLKCIPANPAATELAGAVRAHGPAIATAVTLTTLLAHRARAPGQALCRVFWQGPFAAVALLCPFRRRAKGGFGSEVACCWSGSAEDRICYPTAQLLTLGLGRGAGASAGPQARPWANRFSVCTVPPSLLLAYDGLSVRPQP